MSESRIDLEPDTTAITSQAQESQGNFEAAVARTTARALALYFSRPVRLFRPSKVSGWQFLRGLAAQDGLTLGPKYIVSLVRTQGLMILPKHFLPPMAVNALLGTVLWTSYSEASALLIGHAQIGSHAVAVAALAGALAGGTQAIVSAPCENVRLLIEGGTSGNSWSHAWREVFRGSAHPASRHEAIEEARQTKNWMKEVGDMAGRGWHGLGYTLGKDATGFSAFFAIFEVTRRLALQVRAGTMNVTASGESEGGKLRRHMPQFLYGLTLVTGGAIAGLSYEIIGRPWDVVRHEVRLNALAKERRTPIALLARKIEEEGFSRLFRDPLNTIPERGPRPRIYTMLKTLARVGPWGIGFLVYQAYDTGSND